MEENKKPSNPSAFPTAQIDVCCSGGQMFAGMTLRDYFANSAMQTILDHKYYDGQQMHELNSQRYISNHFDSEPSEKEKEEATIKVLEDAQFIAKRAYLMADAMLKQREY